MPMLCEVPLIGMYVWNYTLLVCLFVADKYLPVNRECGEYLERLKNSGKRIFMITNSKFDFV